MGMKRKQVIVSAFIVCLCSLTAAHAVDLPDLKPGLWQVVTTNPGQKNSVVKNCIDENTTKSLFQQSQKLMGGMCSQFDMSKSGDKYISEAKCQIGPMKMFVKSTMEGNFQDSYTVSTYSKMDPPMMGMGEQESTGVGKYLGACPADMKPGDVQIEGGKSFNSQKIMDEMPKDLMNTLSEAMKNMPQNTQ
jgi:hypothetical protein